MRKKNALHELIINLIVDYQAFESIYKDYNGGLYPSCEEKQKWEAKQLEIYSEDYEVKYKDEK